MLSPVWMIIFFFEIWQINHSFNLVHGYYTRVRQAVTRNALLLQCSAELSGNNAEIRLNYDPQPN